MLLRCSVNRISTLRDFQCCLELKDLYLRKNCIRDLSELEYLQELPNLQVLWLSENPCAYLPNYRNTVLRYLPKLLKLDNIGKSCSHMYKICLSVHHYIVSSLEMCFCNILYCSSWWVDIQGKHSPGNPAKVVGIVKWSEKSRGKFVFCTFVIVITDTWWPRSVF